MLSYALSEALATSGFKSRATLRGDGAVVYRLSNGSGHVLVRQAEWNRLSGQFEAQIAPVRRRTRQLYLGLFPATFIFGMTIGQYLPFAGLIIVAAVFLGPITIYLWQARQVQRVSRSIENSLATFPRSPAAFQRSRRVPRWFEIVFLVLVGPDLVIGIVGEIGGPDFFRGTPLWGSGIGPVEAVSLILIALRLCWPRVAPRLARTFSR